MPTQSLEIVLCVFIHRADCACMYASVCVCSKKIEHGESTNGYGEIATQVFLGNHEDEH